MQDQRRAGRVSDRSDPATTVCRLRDPASRERPRLGLHRQDAIAASSTPAADAPGFPLRAHRAIAGGKLPRSLTLPARRVVVRLTDKTLPPPPASPRTRGPRHTPGPTSSG